MTDTDRVQTILRFNGKALEDHSIDISVLAPALLSLSEMIQNSNKVVNGDKAELAVRVHANIKQNCFEIGLYVDVTSFQYAVDLLTDDRVAVAKEIFEWLEYLFIAGLGLVKLVKLLKKLKGKPIKESQITNLKEDGTVTINTGDGNVIENVNINIVNIYNEPDVRKNVKDALKPLSYPGIDSVELGEKGSSSRITKDDYNGLQDDDVENEEEESFAPNITTEHLLVHKPVLDHNTHLWGFSRADKNIPKNITVDISKTKIAAETMTRGGVEVGDTYKVELEETKHKTDAGNYSTKYKILEVLDFRPAGKRANLFE